MVKVMSLLQSQRQGFSIFKITRIPYQLLSNMVKPFLVELECHPWPSKFPYAFVDLAQRQTAGDDIAEKSISPPKLGQARPMWTISLELRACGLTLDRKSVV